jgi:hypothetical protein
MTDDQREAFYPMQKAINISLQQDCNTLRVRLDGVRARLDDLEGRLEGLEGARDQNVAKDSLVKKVAATLHAFTSSDPNVPADEWLPEARAALVVVAAWFRDHGGYPCEWTAQMLEKEANR